MSIEADLQVHGVAFTDIFGNRIDPSEVEVPTENADSRDSASLEPGTSDSLPRCPGKGPPVQGCKCPWCRKLRP